MGLRLVAVSGIEEIDDRRRFFEAIIKPAEHDHFSQVWNTFQVIDDQIPKEPWVKRKLYLVWSPTMVGIDIPSVLRVGQLLPQTTR